MDKAKDAGIRKPRQARAKARLKHILDVTETLLAERGYDALTTNAVAAEAGFSIGSLYHYFPDKTALLSALVERFYERCLKAIRSYHSVCESTSVSEYVAGLLTALATLEREAVSLTPVFIASLIAAPDLAALDQYYGDALANVLSNHYQSRRPELSEEQAGSVAATVITVLDALFLESVKLSEPRSEPQWDEVKKMLTSYLSLYLD